MIVRRFRTRESHGFGLNSVQTRLYLSFKDVGKTRDQASLSADKFLYTLLGLVGIVEEEAVVGRTVFPGTATS